MFVWRRISGVTLMMKRGSWTAARASDSIKGALHNLSSLRISRPALNVSFFAPPATQILGSCSGHLCSASPLQFVEVNEAAPKRGRGRLSAVLDVQLHEDAFQVSL